MTAEELELWIEESGDKASVFEQALQRAFYLGQPRWQPIETAPKDDTRVMLFDESLLYDDHSYEDCIFIGFRSVEFINQPLVWLDWNACNEYGGEPYEGFRILRPTHWMPFPQPPTECLVYSTCRRAIKHEGVVGE